MHFFKFTQDPFNATLRIHSKENTLKQWRLVQRDTSVGASFFCVQTAKAAFTEFQVCGDKECEQNGSSE